MKDIIITAITLGFVSALARLILPRVKSFKSWLINKLVNKAEKKITGSKMGTAKKEYVCNKLSLFGVKSDEFIDDIIDGTVEAMNNKQVDITSTLKEDITTEITNGIDNAGTSLKNTLSK